MRRMKSLGLAAAFLLFAAEATATVTHTVSGLPAETPIYILLDGVQVAADTSDVMGVLNFAVASQGEIILSLTGEVPPLPPPADSPMAADTRRRVALSMLAWTIQR